MRCSRCEKDAVLLKKEALCISCANVQYALLHGMLSPEKLKTMENPSKEEVEKMAMELCKNALLHNWNFLSFDERYNLKITAAYILKNFNRKTPVELEEDPILRASQPDEYEETKESAWRWGQGYH